MQINYSTFVRFTKNLNINHILFMIKTPKISVIVPVYKAEKYLHRCINSILAQTFTDFEVLLIDDGSPDLSGEICDEFAQKDKRVRVFHKENGGSASARQVGLNNALGEYLIICDSDDWIEADMLNHLYSKAEKNNADLVLCDYFLNYPDGKQRIVSHAKFNLSQERLIGHILCQQINGSSCNKLIRRELYKNHNISYTPSINLGEDVLILLKLLQHPITITYLPKAFYHYQRDRNRTTYTNRITLATLHQLEYVHEWKVKNFSQCNTYNKELFLSNINLAFAALRSDISNETYQKYAKTIPYKKIFKHNVYSLKCILIIISKLNYDIARFMYSNVYGFFYR